MKLYIIILTLTIFSADADVEHEAFQLLVCSNTEEEFYIGYDEEELWHVNFDQETEVLTIPNFIGSLSFAEFYERSVRYIDTCRSYLRNFIIQFESPTPEMDAPQTSIYPKDDVHLGVKNTLICHVTGFYPPTVSISWTKNNVNLTEGINFSQYRPKSDGTFNIFSAIKFTPIIGDVYGCTVHHRALQGKPQTKIWDVDIALPNVGPAVLCGVGLVLGLLGVAAGTFFFIKGKNCN
ncbi:HLA class II histocompatibility antigen, DP alpha 1 chain-like [Labeo rohita]|uniref:HLA class II histocompatibility antigen, DP alpha 1 chain-like n=1 Tax=Labeo rohita TaxID=84645 RepID=UPI0021E33A27|nr:HLA class II histocompatibility antigen, DP alpha 1 chain-like [Labeo rohita]